MPALKRTLAYTKRKVRFAPRLRRLVEKWHRPIAVILADSCCWRSILLPPCCAWANFKHRPTRVINLLLLASTDV